MAESAFSEDGKYYSTISQDGRLRIWDTESNVLKQEYTPDLHLSSPPVCLQWISVAQTSGPSQKGGKLKPTASSQESQCIALGTTSGKILIYSVTQAKVETVLQDEKSSEIRRSCVTALDWHRKSGLYSCNKENLLLEWDLHSGAVRNKYNVNIDSKNKQASSISAIKIIPLSKKTPAKFLVTASWQVRIWRLHSGDAEVIKCLGHNATPKAILALTALNNSCWLIEGSQSERLLSFWDVTITEECLPVMNGEDKPYKKKRKKSVSSAPVVSTPAYNFVLEDAPRQLDVAASSEDGGTKLSLAAATRSGVVHYYTHMLNGTSTKPIKPSVTIQVVTGGALPLPSLCARLAGRDVILGYSQGVAVLFERITPDLKSKTQVLIRGDIAEPKKKSKQQSEVNKVRADASKDGVTYVEPMGGVSRKRITPGGKVEVPMEQRLANLTVDPASRSRAAVSQNLTRLLMQGLHSKDHELILTVLQHNRMGVARQTVSGLPADYVPQLLEQLADLASRRTSQCASACTWLKATLHCHAALLLATVGAHSAQITQILAIFTHRRSHLCQLLNLKGRLELTMSQRERKEEPAEQQQAVLNYNDTSSEEEMEVERPDSGSEGGSEQLLWGRDSASGGDSDSDSAD